jgi:hypothetical protein
VPVAARPGLIWLAGWLCGLSLSLSLSPPCSLSQSGLAGWPCLRFPLPASALFTPFRCAFRLSFLTSGARGEKACGISGGHVVDLVKDKIPTAVKVCAGASFLSLSIHREKKSWMPAVRVCVRETQTPARRPSLASKVLKPEAVCSHARVWRVTYVFGVGARHVRFQHGRSPRPFVFSEVCCVIHESSPCPGPRSRADPRVAASGAAAAAVPVPGHARTHVQRLRERIWAVARRLPMRLLAEPAEAVLHSEGTSQQCRGMGILTVLLRTAIRLVPSIRFCYSYLLPHLPRLCLAFFVSPSSVFLVFQI